MPFSLTDVIILVILGGFAMAGFFFGLIHMVGSFISIVVAAVVSGRYFDFVAAKLAFLFGGYDNLGRVVTFIFLFLFVTRLVGLVFWLIDKLFNLISFIPFLKTFNRLGGAILGAFEGMVLSSLALYLMVRYPLNADLTQALATSKVVDYLLAIANKVAPILPEVIGKAKEVL